jgi:hypothetical protein
MTEQSPDRQRLPELPQKALYTKASTKQPKPFIKNG